MKKEDSDGEETFLESDEEEEATHTFEMQNYLFLFDQEMNLSKKAETCTNKEENPEDEDMVDEEKPLDEKIGLTPQDYK